MEILNAIIWVGFILLIITGFVVDVQVYRRITLKEIIIGLGCLMMIMWMFLLGLIESIKMLINVS